MELLTRADELLRGELRPADSVRLSLFQLLGSVALFGALYGSMMGTFGGVEGDRVWQVVFSSIKMPLLLIVTFLLCVPSFFVLNTLFGVREDFVEALRAHMAAQAGLTLILISFAPFTLLWYASSSDYLAAILCNAVLFGLASMTAQRLLYRYYRPLINRNERHRMLLRLWFVLYAFVGTQMAWVLRPFIGNPDVPVRFFREDAWGNAYLVILQMVLQKLSI